MSPAPPASIGVGRVAHAPADGYTLSLGHWSTHVVNGAIYKLPYDLLDDFEPITLLPSNPMLIVTGKSMPAKNLKELVAWIKDHPNATMGTAGVGSGSHIAGIYFENITGAHVQFVPYRGTDPALLDLMAGRIDMMFDQVSEASREAQRRAHQGLCGHRQDAAAVAARYPDRRRGRTAGPLHQHLVRPVGAEGHAAPTSSPSSTRRRWPPWPTLRCKSASPMLGLDMPPPDQQNAAGARRAAKGRNREVVADHQGRRHQGGVSVQPIELDLAGFQFVDAADDADLLVVGERFEDRRRGLQLVDVKRDVAANRVGQHVAGLALNRFNGRAAARRPAPADGPGSVVLSLIDLIVASTAPQASWPSTMMSGVLSTCTAYSKLATMSSLAKLPATRQTKTSPRATSKQYSGAMRNRATEHRGERILPGAQGFAFMLEIVPSADAFDVTGIAVHQALEAASGETTFSGFGGALELAAWARAAHRKSGGSGRRKFQNPPPRDRCAASLLLAKFAHVRLSVRSRAHPTLRREGRMPAA